MGWFQLAVEGNLGNFPISRRGSPSAAQTKHLMAPQETLASGCERMSKSRLALVRTFVYGTATGVVLTNLVLWMGGF